MAILSNFLNLHQSLIIFIYLFRIYCIISLKGGKWRRVGFYTRTWAISAPQSVHATVHIRTFHGGGWTIAELIKRSIKVWPRIAAGIVNIILLEGTMNRLFWAVPPQMSALSVTRMTIIETGRKGPVQPRLIMCADIIKRDSIESIQDQPSGFYKGF